MVLMMLIAGAALTAANVLAQDQLKIPDSATARTLDNKTVSLAEHRGKLIFLVIWKTDCVACIFEIPMLNKLQKEYFSEDFTVIGLSMDRGKKERVAQIVEEYKIAYPVWLGYGEPISAYTDVPIVPVLLVIGPEGKLAGHFIGAFYSYEHAEAAMKESRAIIEKSKEGE
jgi:thiol-disulfide isomerase/thioredoxin